MDAIVRPKEKITELNDYQKRLIIAAALRQTDGYPKRTERLKKMDFCTDAVKFEVLKAEPKVSDALYNELHKLYFSAENMKPAPQPSGVLQGPGWQEVKVKPERLKPEEITRLIDLYNQGIKLKELSVMFHRTPEALSRLIYYYKHADNYKGLFKMNESKQAEKPQEKKFEEIIGSVDAGRHKEAPDPDSVPKVFKASGKGFLSTDGGLKLDEEPITAMLRQKIKEKGLAQFYAEVEIIVRPAIPTGMTVEVEE